MKKMILILLILASAVGCSTNYVIKGNVLDYQSKTPLSAVNVDIFSNRGHQKVYTDELGKFYVKYDTKLIVSDISLSKDNYITRKYMGSKVDFFLGTLSLDDQYLVSEKYYKDLKNEFHSTTLEKAFNVLYTALTENNFDVVDKDKEIKMLNTGYGDAFLSEGKDPPFDFYDKYKFIIKKRKLGGIKIVVIPTYKVVNRLNATAKTVHNGLDDFAPASLFGDSDRRKAAKKRLEHLKTLIYQAFKIDKILEIISINDFITEQIQFDKELKEDPIVIFK